MKERETMLNPCRVQEFDCLPSTNTYARALAEEGALADGAVILAWEQTAGRGRFDRRFVSPGGAGVYLSYVVRPTWHAREGAYLTTCAAVAVAEAIEQLVETEVKIKWVNDLWIGGKKICGILTEGALLPGGEQMRYAVIGIGINVRHAEMPEELADIATSIEDATGVKPDPREVAAAVIARLDERLASLETHAFMESYRRRSALDGCRVRVTRGEECYDATVRGIGTEGELLLTRESGEEIILVSGEVSVHTVDR